MRIGGADDKGDGFVLPAALLAMVLIGTAVTGGFYASAQEERSVNAAELGSQPPPTDAPALQAPESPYQPSPPARGIQTPWGAEPEQNPEPRADQTCEPDDTVSAAGSDGRSLPLERESHRRSEPCGVQ